MHCDIQNLADFKRLRLNDEIEETRKIFAGKQNTFKKEVKTPSALKDLPHDDFATYLIPEDVNRAKGHRLFALKATPNGDCSLYLDSLSPRELANKVNAAFTELMKDFQPLVCPPSAENTTSNVLQVSEFSVFNSLQQLNPNKFSVPDGVPNWLLREYADILARPVSSVLNSSFSEQRLRQSWKLADVVPLPKQQSIEDVSMRLRPTSLTPSISKLAEDFVVSAHFAPAVLRVIDPDPFGAIPKSCTTQALVSMVHKWLQATDGIGAAVRVVLFDYRKAFDLIDHNLLVNKILDLPIS